ncbi:hypothetical protein FACS1894205_7230 [Alphaproteobacteria bacterium]|nr:hypothetical protein FACS1894205_7230 [Alphaproteobacteria bacterium]
MKKILAVLLVLLVVVGVVVGASFLGIGPLAPYFHTAPEVASPEPEKIEIPKAIEEAPRAYYYDLGSIVVPVFKGSAISRQIEVELAIKVRPEDGRRISNDLPRLKNTVVLALYDFLPSYVDQVTPESKKMVRDRLLKILSEKYGEDAMLDVVVKIMRLR